MRLLTLATLLAVCAGFNQAPQVPRSAVQLRRAALVMDEAATEAPAEEATEEAAAEAAAPAVEYSESLPFLVKRPQLKGYIGDVGFDPLGFSEILPMDWLREAELKHCRVSMLAFVGFIFTDFYTLPAYQFTTLEAHDAGVANGSMSQILLWVGLLEVFSFIAIDQMLRGSGRAPGDYGFDPVGFVSDKSKLEEMQMKELANGRLAMFAFGGAVTQAVLTGNTFPWLFGDATTFGSGGDFAWNIVP